MNLGIDEKLSWIIWKGVTIAIMFMLQFGFIFHLHWEKNTMDWWNCWYLGRDYEWKNTHYIIWVYCCYRKIDTREKQIVKKDSIFQKISWFSEKSNWTWYMLEILTCYSRSEKPWYGLMNWDMLFVKGVTKAFCFEFVVWKLMSVVIRKLGYASWNRCDILILIL